MSPREPIPATALDGPLGFVGSARGRAGQIATGGAPSAPGAARNVPEGCGAVRASAELFE
jgi:hypothetical protein